MNTKKRMWTGSAATKERGERGREGGREGRRDTYLLEHLHHHSILNGVFPKLPVGF